MQIDHSNSLNIYLYEQALKTDHECDCNITVRFWIHILELIINVKLILNQY